MKIQLIRLLAILIFAGLPFANQSQSKTQVTAVKKYPATFNLTHKQVQSLFNYKPNEKVGSTNSKFLKGGTVLANTSTGDMKFLRLQLSYFKNAFLNIQVNGSFSTQLFIVSSDKSVFYKGRFENNNWVLTQCAEDDIISE